MVEITSSSHFYVQADRDCIVKCRDGKSRKVENRFAGVFVDGNPVDGPEPFEKIVGHAYSDVLDAWVAYCRLNGLWDRDNDVD